MTTETQPLIARRTLAALAMGATVLPDPSAAAADERVTVTRAAGQAPRRAPAEHFTGQAEVTSPFGASTPARASGAVVSFAPGARTDWHTHPLGQTLVVLGGTGLVQHWGGPAQRIGPGDVAWIPPGVKHWHGAAPTEPMSHVAIGEMLDGKTVDWLEKVSDGQYEQASRDAQG